MLSLSADAAPITITDLENRTITLKETPQRIVVGNYILNFLMVGGTESLKKVVALPQDGWQATRFGEYTALTKSFPEIKKIPSIGGYHDNILNTEKIISLKPDLLLINKSQYADNNKRVEVLQKAGIPTVVLDYHALTAANHTQSTKILGELLNQKSTAESLNRRYLEVADIVRERVSKLPESAKARRVYVETGSKGPGEYGNTYNKGVLWGGIQDPELDALINEAVATTDAQKRRAVYLKAFKRIMQKGYFYVLGLSPDLIAIRNGISGYETGFTWACHWADGGVDHAKINQ